MEYVIQSFKISTETRKKLKLISAQEEVTMGKMIEILIEMYNKQKKGEWIC